jgi:hypothetical protein
MQSDELPHWQYAPVPVTCPAIATDAKGAELKSLSSDEIEYTIGRMSMQTAANNNLVLTDISSLKRLADVKNAISYGGFYQQIISGLIKGVYSKQVFTDFGDRLVALAEHAYCFRQIETVKQASQLLMIFPLGSEYKKISNHYSALYKYQTGQFPEALKLFKTLAEDAPQKFRARALLSMAGTFFDSGDFSSSTPLYLEAGRAGDRCGDLFTVAQSQKMIAILKGMGGDHQGALDHLESVFPTIRAASSSYPYLYYDYLNSFAVEMTKVGRLEEAKRASDLTLASAYASAYPEWRETREEINLKAWRASRSFVSIARTSPTQNNLLRLPLPENGNINVHALPRFVRPKQRARVLDYLDWKKKMVKEPNDTPQDEQPPEMLTGHELLLRIIQRASVRDLTEDQLRRMYEAVKKIASEPIHRDKP